ncbi:hypothetical protein DB347_14150 [Opitutaceae bacterium EW11]|nr:hypothetical protein DB347_14150 [Opitutaceae bacterium EW11]
MKILKIFGLVVGIHVVAFMFVFAIPGCRSTSRHSPRPGTPDTSMAPATGAYSAPESASPITSSSLPPSSDASLNPPVSSASPTVSFNPNPAPTVHFNPTRPGSPAAAAAGAGGESTPATTYTVASGDTLWKIAKQNGLSVKELAAANKLRADAPLHQGQKLMIPGKTAPMSTGAAPSVAGAAESLTYKVKAGDTLAIIARRAGTTPAAIKSLNHLRSDTVRAGQELILPAGASTAAALASTPEPEAAASAARTSSGSVKHIVKSGETLSVIAKKYGVTRSAISVANNIADPLKIRAGQELIIPNPKTTPPHNGANHAAPAETTPAQTAPAPAPESQPASPIAPAGDTGASPIAAPSNEQPAPPVIQVQDSNSPVSAPKP